MRDAFGGSFMIKLFLLFIIIYVGFTALALNYAKAFKVKNKVIDYIEQNELYNFDSMSAETKNSMETFFETEILGKMNYRATIGCSHDRKEKYCNNGIRIEEAGKAENTEGVYYRVTTSIGWSAPFINSLLSFNGSKSNRNIAGYWRISGETRLIVKSE